MLGWLISYSLSFAQSDFMEVAVSQNISHSYVNGTFGGGVSFVDFNGDGWDDLTFATSNGESILFYENQQGIFSAVDLGLNNNCESKQILWLDFDNDGDKDLFFNCVNDRMRLFRNDGNLQLTDVSEAMGLSVETEITFGANWADFDRDGWVDLYITSYGPGINQLYKNNKGISFTNITQESGVSPNSNPTYCALVFDYDNDGWEDIYMANDRVVGNELIRNIDGSSFEDVSVSSGSNLAMNAMGATIFDMNSDGFFEIYVSNSPEGNALLFNNGDGTFDDIAEQSGTIFNSVGWGVNAFDFNNDSYIDIYVSGTTVGTESFLSSALYEAMSETQYTLTQFSGMTGDTLRSFSNAIGDINNDGNLDIAVNNYAYPSQLWENACINSSHWLKVQTEGVISNREGIGSKLAVYANGKVYYQYRIAGTSFMGQNADYVHFGLGTNEAIDSLIVYWPSGLTDKLTNITADQKIQVVEGVSSQIFNIKPASTNAICSSETIELTLDLYGRNMEILWSIGTTGKSIEVTEAGEFWATITVGSLVINTDTVQVEFEDPPEVNITTLPAGSGSLGTIDIQPTGGTQPFTYSWQHDPGINSGNLSGLQPGTYVVTISTPGGCSIQKDILVESITALDEIDPLHQQLPLKYWSQNDHLFIEFVERPDHLVIYNLMGQVIYQKAFSRKTDNLVMVDRIRAPQIYIMYFRLNDQHLFQKILVR